MLKNKVVISEEMQIDGNAVVFSRFGNCQRSLLGARLTLLVTMKKSFLDVYGDTVLSGRVRNLVISYLAPYGIRLINAAL